MLTTVVVLLLGFLVTVVVPVVANALVLRKADESWWKALIPFFGDWTMASVATTSTKLCVAVVALPLAVGVLATIGTIVGGQSLSAAFAPTDYSYYGSGTSVSPGIFDIISSGGVVVDTTLALCIVCLCLKYLVDCVVFYQLAIAFDENSGLGAVCVMFPLMGKLIIALDPEIAYGGPVG